MFCGRTRPISISTAYFYLHVSNRNFAIWSKENPHSFATTIFLSPKVTVWCGFTAKQMLLAFYFESTVNGAAYLEMLKSNMKIHLQGTNEVTFQQDGAPPHIAESDFFLSETFGDRWTFPDLNPADFWLWGHLKNRDRQRPKTLEELKP